MCFFSGVFTFSPVFGFLEILAFCTFVENTPNPLNSTLSPLLRVFLISFKIIFVNFSKSFLKKFG